ETGNALRTQARPEAKTTVDIIRYFGGLGSELKGETIPFGEHVLSYTRREPLGVVGAIILWNAPVLLAALKIGPALCAGNTLVLKTAEDAPLGVLMLAEVCQEFLPPGVLNVLTGLGEECGAPLANHPMVNKLSFTGSTEVGKLIMRAASDRIVPVSLELGGKSPSIVFPDANEDWVVDGIIAAMRFTRQSQSCTAGSRLPASSHTATSSTIFLMRRGKRSKRSSSVTRPVLVAIPWTDEADAIRMANDSHYGLAAYVWSHDIGRALRAAHAIEAGWVQVN